MNKILSSYKSTLILLGSVIIGGAVGVVLGPKATVLKPFGDLFLNLLFMTLVPLVFFSVTSAISNMEEMKRLGKILKNVVIVFLSTSLVAAVIALIIALIFNPTKGLSPDMFSDIISSADPQEATEKIGILQQLVNTVTVTDFNQLLSKSNMLQIIVFSMIFGTATALAGKKGEPIAKFVKSGSHVMMRIIDIIMYYAPIGLGCYFATVIGELGPQIIGGYVKVFVLCTLAIVIYYFAALPFYAYIAGGKQAVKNFFREILPPTVTSLATCSSAASMPVNLEATKKIGVPKDIAETVIPLGISTHKDGSVIGGVFKIVFLFGLLGRDMTSISTILGILVVAFLVGVVMGAIPGGGAMGEMLIISIYAFDPTLLPIIMVISTIIDAPVTVVNSTSNTASAMLVSRLVEGKRWLSK